MSLHLGVFQLLIALQFHLFNPDGWDGNCPVISGGEPGRIRAVVNYRLTKACFIPRLHCKFSIDWGDEIKLGICVSLSHALRWDENCSAWGPVTPPRKVEPPSTVTCGGQANFASYRIPFVWAAFPLAQSVRIRIRHSQ